MIDTKHRVALWLSWIVFAAAIYYPAAGLRPYSDDTVQVDIALGNHQDYNESTYFFRPLQTTFIGWDWRVSGPDFVASKALAFILLLVRTALVYALARKAMPRAAPLGPALISWLYVAHPILVAATGKMDNNTESLCAALALGLVYFLLSAPASDARRLVVFGLIVIAGLFTKETFVGMAVASPLLLWLAQTPRSSRLLRHAVVIAALALGTYFAARWFAGRSAVNVASHSRYQLHIGLNLVKNIVASAGAMVMPGSLLDVFVQLKPLKLAGSAALLLTVAIARLRRGLALSTPAQQMFFVAAIAGLFPIVILNGWPSEHHLTMSAGFVLLSVACPLLEAPKLSRATVAVAAVLIMWMGFHAWTKTVAERRMSDRAQQLGDAMMAEYARAPTPHVQLCVVFDTSKKYGQFALPDHYMTYHQLYRFGVSYPGVSVSKAKEIPSAAAADAGCTLVADGLVMRSVSR